MGKLDLIVAAGEPWGAIALVTTPRTLTPKSQCQLRKEMINTCNKVKSIEG